jgi:hypothetical protein
MGFNPTGYKSNKNRENDGRRIIYRSVPDEQTPQIARDVSEIKNNLADLSNAMDETRDKISKFTRH